MPQIQHKGGWRAKLFSHAFRVKLDRLNQGYTTTQASRLYDWLVFSKISARFGGRLQYVVRIDVPAWACRKGNHGPAQQQVISCVRLQISEPKHLHSSML